MMMVTRQDRGKLNNTDIAAEAEGDIVYQR